MKLLITGAVRLSSEAIGEIEKDHEIVFMQDEREEVPVPCEQIEGAICNGLFLYHSIEKFTSLKLIQLSSTGLDRVPLDYIRARGIKLYSARGVYGVPMAEFAMCGVLQIYKQSAFFRDNQREKKWEKRRDLLELDGKTVCVVGCGGVGKECAKRFWAFGCRIIGIDIFEGQAEFFERIYKFSELENRLSESDVVVLTLPLTDETRRLFDKKKFDAMKSGAVFVNVARGAIVDERALSDALETKLSGAVLDVFDEEPLSPDSRLWEKDNALITPHNSFVGDGNAKRLERLILENLKGVSK